MPSPTRRRPRRAAPRKRAYLLGGTLVLVALVVISVLGFSLWVKRYLQSDEFRTFMSRSTSDVMKGHGEFSNFTWSGSSFHSNELNLVGLPESPYDELRFSGIRANVDFGTFRSEAWQISDVSVNRLELVVRSDKGESTVADSPSASLPSSSETGDKPHTFWSRWLPQKVRVTEIDVANLEFLVAPAQMEGRGIRMAMSPLSGDEGWNVQWNGGTLKIGESPEMQVDQLHARVRDQQLFLTDAAFDLETGARLSLNGEIDLARSELDLAVHVDDLNATKVLTPDWKQRLEGTLHGNVSVTGDFSSPVPLTQRGRFWLKNGILQTLPVLDHIAEHTRTERFRRLILNGAESEFERIGDNLWLKGLVLQSDGLIRIEGDAHVGPAVGSEESRPLTGQFRVGVVRETLKWLPGAEAKVFTEERDGYLWTTMGIAGTLDEPKEDLSIRLRGAAFETAVEEAPLRMLEAGQDIVTGATGIVRGATTAILPSGLEDATVNPAEETARKVLDKTESLMREGLLYLPLFGNE